jgi:hypothetical protein
MPLSPEAVKDASLKSMSQEGAKELVDITPAYVSTKSQYDEARKKWLASIKVGSVVDFGAVEQPVPWKVAGIDVTRLGTRYKLTNMFATDEVRENIDAEYIHPYSPKVATQTILWDRLTRVKDAVIKVDEQTLITIEDLLAKHSAW